MTMLSVAEARAKARKRLNSSMAAWAADGVDEMRLEIALRPPTEKQVLADQTAAAAWAADWRGVDEKATTAGLEIDWQDRSWSRIGRQRIPIRLRLTTPDEAAAFVGGETARDWARLRDRAAVIRQRLGDRTNAAARVDAEGSTGTDAVAGTYGLAGTDAVAGTDGDCVACEADPLAAAIRSQAKRILSLSAPGFDTVIAVVDWLRGHRLGSLRPRQLPIRGVDSKWFETHRGLVTALLTGIGHADAVSVLDAEPRMRLRILDPAIGPDRSGLDDITAPISQLSGLPVSPRLVFVFENLETVLAMPAWPAAVAIHGSGYAVDAVARLRWLAGARVIYWGDLDSHGFAILNRLRAHLPGAESVLMDEATLLAHKDLWVPEPKPASGTFRELTGSEARALERIRTEGDVRLEQERIPWDTALTRLAAAVGEPTRGRRSRRTDAGPPRRGDPASGGGPG